MQNVLSEEVACYLPANAVVDFYKYQADIFTICSGSWCRDLTSTGYTSTAFVYQDLDGVIIDGLSINDPPGKVSHRGVVPKDIFTTRYFGVSLTTSGDVESNPGPGTGR